jgi:alkaline phosphatase
MELPPLNPLQQLAQKQLAERLSMRYQLGRAKRVVLFISDGMGLGTQYATRIFEGQRLGLFGEEHMTTLDSAMHVGVSKTYTLNAQTPDSAGTATAFMSGTKTINGVINTRPQLGRSVCNSSFHPADYGMPTILDAARALGYRNGVVSTARLTHATPSAAYAVSADRLWEWEVPEDCPQADIGRQRTAPSLELAPLAVPSMVHYVRALPLCVQLKEPLRRAALTWRWAAGGNRSSLSRKEGSARTKGTLSRSCATPV